MRNHSRVRARVQAGCIVAACESNLARFSLKSEATPDGRRKRSVLPKGRLSLPLGQQAQGDSPPSLPLSISLSESLSLISVCLSLSESLPSLSCTPSLPPSPSPSLALSQFVFASFFSFSANTFGYASFGRIAGVPSPSFSPARAPCECNGPAGVRSGFSPEGSAAPAASASPSTGHALDLKRACPQNTMRSRYGHEKQMRRCCRTHSD